MSRVIKSSKKRNMEYGQPAQHCSAVDVHLPLSTNIMCTVYSKPSVMNMYMHAHVHCTLQPCTHAHTLYTQYMYVLVKAFKTHTHVYVYIHV